MFVLVFWGGSCRQVQLWAGLELSDHGTAMYYSSAPCVETTFLRIAGILPLGEGFKA